MTQPRGRRVTDGIRIFPRSKKARSESVDRCGYRGRPRERDIVWDGLNRMIIKRPGSRILPPSSIPMPGIEPLSLRSIFVLGLGFSLPW